MTEIRDGDPTIRTPHMRKPQVEEPGLIAEAKDADPAIRTPHMQKLQVEEPGLIAEAKDADPTIRTPHMQKLQVEEQAEFLMPEPGYWEGLTNTEKLAKAWKTFAEECGQIKKYAPTAWDAIGRRDWKKAFNPNNPIATLLMEVLGIEGCQIFRPFYRPEDDKQGQEVNNAIQHPHRYKLENFKKIPLHLESGQTVPAWYHAPEDNFPTIVYCHGALGTLYDRKPQLEMFAKNGFGVIIAAYPGMKTDEPPPKGQIEVGGQRFPVIDPTERACVETGRAMVQYVLNKDVFVPYDDDPEAVRKAILEYKELDQNLTAEERAARIDQITNRERKSRRERMGKRKKLPHEGDPNKIILFGESIGSAIALQTALLLEKGEHTKEEKEEIQYKMLTGQYGIKNERENYLEYQVGELCRHMMSEALTPEQRQEARSAMRHALGVEIQPEDIGDAAYLRKMIGKAYMDGTYQERFAAFLQELQQESGLPEAHPLKEYQAVDYDPSLQCSRESLTVPAVICWAPSTSLVDKAHEEFPGFNADFWLSNRFESKKHIGAINYGKTKVLVMHGLSDDLIGPEHSEALKSYSHNKADVFFLDGCNHGLCKVDSTHREWGTAEVWGTSDPGQLNLIGNLAQHWLSKQGLCPAPAVDPEWGRVHTTLDRGPAPRGEKEESLTFNRSSGLFTKPLTEIDRKLGNAVMTSVVVHPDNALTISVGRASDEKRAESILSGYKDKVFALLAKNNIPVADITAFFVNANGHSRTDYTIPASYGPKAARALKLNSAIQEAISTNQIHMLPSLNGTSANGFVARTASRKKDEQRERD